MRYLITTCTLLPLIGAFSPLFHPPCFVNQGCVPRNQCVNGVISTTGVTILRSGSERICTNPVNPGVPSICCNKHEVIQYHPPCPTNQGCVPDNQCVNGVISTTGGDQTILRSGYERICTNPGNHDVPSICCNLHGVPTPRFNFTPCPFDKRCVDPGLCSESGKIIIDGSQIGDIRIGNVKLQLCYVDQTTKKEGICCTPPGSKTDSSKTPPPDKCGVRNSNTVPGQSSASQNEAKFGEFPWQGVILKSDDTFVGGASLIGRSWVVTAAHKVHRSTPHDIKVRLGEWKVKSFDEPKPFVDVDVAAITIHPDFVHYPVQNNIAVLKLVVPVAYQYHISPICLPSPGQTFRGKRCIATGWGQDTSDGQYQQIMKKVELPRVEYHQCQIDLQTALSNLHFKLDKSFMCAGGEDNKDACNGDGGGPLACEITGGHYVLTGITSHGIGECGTKDVPGIYADVQVLLPFVNDVEKGNTIPNSYN